MTFIKTFISIFKDEETEAEEFTDKIVGIIFTMFFLLLAIFGGIDDEVFEQFISLIFLGI